jgi:hypothetical protein
VGALNQRGVSQESCDVGQDVKPVTCLFETSRVSLMRGELLILVKLEKVITFWSVQGTK